MKRLTFALLILLTVLAAKAQITFQKTFFCGTNYPYGQSVQQTTDGGFIIAGSFGPGNSDVYLIKTDANGDSLWTRTFGGVLFDAGTDVQQTWDGGYVITGFTGSFGVGSTNAHLIKTDTNGNLLWSKTYGGPVNDNCYSVRQTTDGGYIITGATRSFGAGYQDVNLIKSDANGNLLWTKTFGGADNEEGYSVQQTIDGGYVITGYTGSFGVADVYLIKTDTNGNSLWTKTIGGSGLDGGYSVQQTTDGGYIIAGFTNSFGAGSYDVYLIKTDTNGNPLWTKTIGGAGYDLSYSVHQATDGGYIITGWTGSFSLADVYLIKTDANGNLLWTKTFGGANNDRGYSVQQTTDGGYIIAGFTNSFGAGSYDVYLIKTDSLGNSGCNEGSTATIVNTPATQVYSPPTIVTSPSTIITTPATIVGSGGIVTTLCTTVGINEITTDKSFLIAPNPSFGNFIILFERTIMKGNIEILNILGKTIFTENIFNESKMEIHLKNISDGIYFVKVFDGEKSYCKKLIIEED